jgi:predicted oxidoreductase
MLTLNWDGPEFISRTTEAVRIAYDSGITFFDTADVYADGRSEEALGKFLKQSPEARRRVAIQSKCGAVIPESGTYRVDLSCAHIVHAAECSLRRLGIERLDVLLLHVLHPLMEPTEIARAFDRLFTDGKVRHFGLSNHSVAQLELLRRHVAQPIVTSQIKLSLAHHPAIRDQSSYGGLVDYCYANEIVVQAYSPLKGVETLGTPVLLDGRAAADAKSQPLIQLLDGVAKNHATTRAAIMLAWLLRHPAGIVPVIGATKTEHILDSCSADRICLSNQEWSALFEAAASLHI